MRLVKVILYFLLAVLSPSVLAQKQVIDSLHHVLKISKDDTGKVSTLNRLSIKLLDAGQYDTSLAYADKAINLAEILDFKKGLAKAYAICGDNYAYKDNYPKILENDLKALALYQELRDKKATASVFGSIGNAYWNQGNYPKALECDFKGLAINQEIGNKSGIAVSLAGIGTIYMDQGNDAKALEYYLKAMNMNKDLGNKNALANNYCNVGNA
ncbi:MAG TPA: tetratricopeptide repeat protein, partial [Bacteroidia bacterium]|nr:tetratricopeptide repeat protein [Bacteroidia bacterium]